MKGSKSLVNPYTIIYVDGRITALFKMEVARWEELVKFAKDIGFDLKDKEFDLENFINSKRAFNHKTQMYIINILNKFGKKQFHLTDMVKTTGKSYDAVRAEQDG